MQYNGGVLITEIGTENRKREQFNACMAERNPGPAMSGNPAGTDMTTL
jgi:hypothetical protein